MLITAKQIDSDRHKYLNDCTKPQLLRVEFYKSAKLYIETSPPETVVKLTLKSLLDKKELLDNRFEEWSKVRRSLDNPRQEYEKINEYDTLNRQIKFYKYLLQIN